MKRRERGIVKGKGRDAVCTNAEGAKELQLRARKHYVRV